MFARHSPSRLQQHADILLMCAFKPPSAGDGLESSIGGDYKPRAPFGWAARSSRYEIGTPAGFVANIQLNATQVETFVAAGVVGSSGGYAVVQMAGNVLLQISALNTSLGFVAIGNARLDNGCKIVFTRLQ